MKNRIVIILTLTMVFAMGILIQISRMDSLNRFWHNSGWDELNAYKAVSRTSDTSGAETGAENYLILYDSRQTGNFNSLVLAKNISHVLNYMKKPNIIADVHTFGGNFANYSGVVVAFEDLTACPGMDALIRFVEQGGGVFFAQSPLSNPALGQISARLGIVGLGKKEDDQGVIVKTNLLIRGKGTIVNQNFLYNYYLTVQLAKKCTIHITTLDNHPLLWDVAYGKGKFVVFNGTMLNIKLNRGIITGAISLMHDDYLYPIINLKICYIDDFPAPIPQEFIKNVSHGYGRSFANFYRQVWWPDILKTVRKYHLIYNGMIIETYEARKEPPFDSVYSTSSTTLRTYGRELLKNGGELGIHGYNHQPLAPKGYIKYEKDYRPWPSKANMTAAIRETGRYFKTVFPNYKMVSYVPPSNILSPMGREALIDGMPDLKIIASVYQLDFHYVEDIYDQEYEVKDDGVIELPRMTSGYEKTQQVDWAVLNGITSIGVFSHFIHPDDVSETYRNDHKDWDQLYREYEALHQEIYQNFNWLRNMKVSDAGLSLEKYLNTQITVKYSSNAIEVRCNRLSGLNYFILRTSKTVKVPKGFSINPIDHNVYLIGVGKSSGLIKLGR